MQKKKLKAKDIITNVLLSFLLGVVSVAVIWLICCICTVLMPVIGVTLIGGVILFLIKTANKKF